MGTKEPSDVRVGGWGWAIAFLGWIGGLIGYLSLSSDDPRRANHVLKWGVIWSVIMVALAGALTVALVAIVAVSSNDDGGSDVTAFGSTSTTAVEPDLAPTSDGASAAGKPCIALADPLPAGAPDVPVTVGPPPTELVSQDLVVGIGETVVPTSSVTVDYIGVACSTGRIFDTSYGTQPATFPLSGVIPGWSQGLPGMKVGGTRLLGIPSDLAYGGAGYPPDIAPDEALWFVVALKDA